MNSEQVCRQAGISRRQLDNWVAKGFIKSVNAAGVGFGGIVREYSATEARVAEYMGNLTKAGMYPSQAEKVARGNAGALSKLLAAVGPCLGSGELRYRLPQEGRERAYGQKGAAEVGSAPCARPALPACTRVAQESVAGELCE